MIDVPLIFFCPADHVVSYWQPRILLGPIGCLKKNQNAPMTSVKGRHTGKSVVYDPLSLATDSGYVFFIILYIKKPLSRSV